MKRFPNERQAGLTLLEVIVAASVLAVALIGLLSGLLSSMRLRQLNEEKAVARNAAEEVLSAIRGVPGAPGLPALVAAYQRFGGGGPEETFAVRGLADPAPGEAVGRVIVWRLKGGNPPDPASPLPWTAADLAEARALFGMPFPLALTGTESALQNDFLDTNLDGNVDGADRPSLMPVTVRIRWRSRSNVQTQYFSTVVGRR